MGEKMSWASEGRAPTPKSGRFPRAVFAIFLLLSLASAATESSTYLLEDEELALDPMAGESATYAVDAGPDAGAFDTAHFESWDWDEDLWYELEARDELGALIPGATVTAGESLGTLCVEPAAPNGTYYCALPFNHGPAGVLVAKPGYVTTLFALALTSDVLRFNATGVKTALKLVANDELNRTFAMNGTSSAGFVAAASHSPWIRYRGGAAYVVTAAADAYLVNRTGYVATLSGALTPTAAAQTTVRFGHDGNGCTANSTSSCQPAVPCTLRVVFRGCSGPIRWAEVELLDRYDPFAVLSNRPYSGDYIYALDPAIDDGKAITIRISTGPRVILFPDAVKREVNDSSQHVKQYDLAVIYGCSSGSSSYSPPPSAPAPGPSTGGGPRCGDGRCETREGDEGSCPEDCGCPEGTALEGGSCRALAPPEVCGDGACGAGEAVASCPADCSSCGDGACTGTETSASCPVDCSACGDGACTGAESSASCPADCSSCGDGACTGSEDPSSCCKDCGCPAGERCDSAAGACRPAAQVCGDGSCSWGEDASSCCADCPCPSGSRCDGALSICLPASVCGDGSCGLDEGSEGCPADCAVCGDRRCEGAETRASCCADCGCDEGRCNYALGVCVSAECGDERCDEGELLTCPADCASCGDGRCGEGEPCCADCGCHAGEVCDALTEGCVAVEGESRATFDYAPSAVQTGAGAPEPLERSVESVAALVTRSRARANTGPSPSASELSRSVRSLVERSLEATREVEARREVVVRNTTRGVRSTVSLRVRNAGPLARRQVRVVETVPKEVAGSASQLVFDPQPDEVLRDDPVVAWTVDLGPGEELAVTYTVARDLSVVREFPRPVVLVEEDRCGDGACTGLETAPSCPSDCARCGDGACTSGETPSTCCDDCPCPAGRACLDGACSAGTRCGDGACTAGETPSTCCDDCPCPAGQACREGACAAVEAAAYRGTMFYLAAAVVVLVFASGWLGMLSLAARGRRGPAEPAAPQAPLAPAATPPEAAAAVEEAPSAEAEPFEVAELAIESMVDVMELKSEAIEAALSEARPGAGLEEDAAWCTRFLDTYRPVERLWLVNLLRLSGFPDDVLAEAERRAASIAPPLRPDVAVLAFEENVRRVMAFIDTNPEFPPRALAEAARKGGFDEGEVEEALRRLALRDGAGGEGGAVIR